MIELVRHHDVIQPFMLNNSLVRGRLVRLEQVIASILSRHAYPDVVSRALGELLLISAMLSTNLPEGGILTLQIKSDGVIPFMVVDVQQDGSLRGYANLTDNAEATLTALIASTSHPTVSELFGKGYMAITLDMPHGEPYQGIVPLEGATLADAVTHYFTQSQQLDVLFHLVINRRMDENATSHWMAAGIMLERMPDMPSPENAEMDGDLARWDYQSLLVRTAREDELLDPHLAPSALLYRLFNEGGVWVYDTRPIKDQCRCSRSKIQYVLMHMPAEEVASLYNKEGVISVVCQFCSREERLTKQDIAE
jgi:molecular chaperone Hsp33